MVTRKLKCDIPCTRSAQLWAGLFRDGVGRRWLGAIAATQWSGKYRVREKSTDTYHATIGIRLASRSTDQKKWIPESICLWGPKRSLENGCNCVNRSFDKMPLKGGNKELMLRYVSVSRNSSPRVTIFMQPIKTPTLIESSLRRHPRYTLFPHPPLVQVWSYRLRTFHIKFLVRICKIPPKEFFHISTFFFI